MNTKLALGQVIRQVKTTKMTCTSCKASFVIPAGGEMDCGECEKCGCTSYHLTEGRPWGHKHRFWNDWVRGLYDLDAENRATPQTLALFKGLPKHEISQYLVF